MPLTPNLAASSSVSSPKRTSSHSGFGDGRGGMPRVDVTCCGRKRVTSYLLLVVYKFADSLFHKLTLPAMHKGFLFIILLIPITIQSFADLHRVISLTLFCLQVVATLG